MVLRYDVCLNFRGVHVKENREEKLLGVILDEKLCFKGSLSPIVLTLATALFTLFTLELNSCIIES